MSSENRQLTAPDGRSVRLLVSTPTTDQHRGDVILAPVFGGTAQSMFSFAHTLTLNGFRVIRLDFRDHVGLSDGNIADTRLSMQVEDVKVVTEAFPGAILMAVSLSCRPAVRAVADGAPISGVVLVTPVLHLQHTLHQVTGIDYFGVGRDDLSPLVTVIDYDVRDQFIYDSENHRLVDLPTALNELRDLTVPVRMIAGDADPWVSVEETRHVHDDLIGQGHDSMLTVVAAASHRLNRNPAVAMSYMEESVRSCLSIVRYDDEPVVPSFDDLLHARGQDRVARRMLTGVTE